MFDLTLFIVSQLGWVIDLHLVFWQVWFILVRLGLAIFVPDCYWHFNRVLRAVWVGDFYRPCALAWLRYIWFFLPVCFKVRDWLPIWIRDRHGTLGIWYLVQVRRHTICRVRVVLVRLGLTIFVPNRH